MSADQLRIEIADLPLVENLTPEEEAELFGAGCVPKRRPFSLEKLEAREVQTSHLTASVTGDVLNLKTDSPGAMIRVEQYSTGSVLTTAVTEGGVKNTYPGVAGIRLDTTAGTGAIDAVFSGSLWIQNKAGTPQNSFVRKTDGQLYQGTRNLGAVTNLVTDADSGEVFVTKNTMTPFGITTNQPFQIGGTGVMTETNRYSGLDFSNATLIQGLDTTGKADAFMVRSYNLYERTGSTWTNLGRVSQQGTVATDTIIRVGTTVYQISPNQNLKTFTGVNTLLFGGNRSGTATFYLIQNQKLQDGNTGTDMGTVARSISMDNGGLAVLTTTNTLQVISPGGYLVSLTNSKIIQMSDVGILDVYAQSGKSLYVLKNGGSYYGDTEVQTNGDVPIFVNDRLYLWNASKATTTLNVTRNVDQFRLADNYCITLVSTGRPAVITSNVAELVKLSDQVLRQRGDKLERFDGSAWKEVSSVTIKTTGVVGNGVDGSTRCYLGTPPSSIMGYSLVIKSLAQSSGSTYLLTANGTIYKLESGLTYFHGYRVVRLEQVAIGVTAFGNASAGGFNVSTSKGLVIPSTFLGIFTGFDLSRLVGTTTTATGQTHLAWGDTVYTLVNGQTTTTLTGIKGFAVTTSGVLAQLTNNSVKLFNGSAWVNAAAPTIITWQTPPAVAQLAISTINEPAIRSLNSILEGITVQSGVWTGFRRDNCFQLEFADKYFVINTENGRILSIAKSDGAIESVDTMTSYGFVDGELFYRMVTGSLFILRGGSVRASLSQYMVSGSNITQLNLSTGTWSTIGQLTPISGAPVYPA